MNAGRNSPETSLPVFSWQPYPDRHRVGDITIAVRRSDDSPSMYRAAGAFPIRSFLFLGGFRMTTGEVIRLLRSEGLPASLQRIHYALQMGYVDRPPMNGARCLVFGEREIGQVREYLKGGRRAAQREVATK